MAATTMTRGKPDLVVPVEVKLDELPETGRVVVSGGLGITKRLEERVGSENTGLEVGDVTTTTVRVGEVSEQVLGRLGLPCARLARAHDGLREAEIPHVTVCLVRDRVHMRRQNANRLPLVVLHVLLSVAAVGNGKVSKNGAQEKSTG